MIKRLEFILRVISTIVVFTCVFQSTYANAQSCSYSSGSAANVNITAPSTVTVPRDAPIGAVIYDSGQVIHPSNGLTINCSSGPQIGVKNVAGSQPVASAILFPIGDTGLSYKLAGNMGFVAAYPQSSSQSGWSTTSSNSYRVQIVKTGDIRTGTTLSAQPLGDYVFGTLVGLHLLLTGSITVTQPACSTQDVRVDLGQPPISRFTGVGSRVATTAFNIALNNCPSGINSVSYQLDATTAVVNPSISVVALNGASTASGIGLQVLDKAFKPIPLGTAIPVTGYSAAGGNFLIALNAAYYQTAATVGPGTANGSLIFTMTYQ
nr:Fimbria adhesin protein [Paraburkholderia busanensis]